MDILCEKGNDRCEKSDNEDEDVGEDVNYGDTVFEIDAVESDDELINDDVKIQRIQKVMKQFWMWFLCTSTQTTCDDTVYNIRTEHYWWYYGEHKHICGRKNVAR